MSKGLGGGTGLYMLCLGIEHWRLVVMAIVGVCIGVGYALGSM